MTSSTTLTPQQLTDYFTGKKKRLSYNEALIAYDFLRFHFDGPLRTINLYTGATQNTQSKGYSLKDAQLNRVYNYLIQQRRPSESAEIYEYRKTIFECITVEATSRLLKSLTKIKRSSDWSITYPEKSPASVADGETLEDYCEYNFPYYTSLTNWAFAVLLKNILIDPNAVCLVAPLSTDTDPADYRKPYPVIYNSDQVFEYKEDEYAILLSVERTDDNGKIFLIVTPDVIERWEESKGDKTDFTLTDTYEHGLGVMPCFRLPGNFKKAYSTDLLQDSPINSMVPRLNDAVREYSDLQASVVMHLFPEKWEYASQKCEECFDPILGSSPGYTKQGKKLVWCQKCNGTGLMGAAPYKKTVLAVQKKIDDKDVPVPTPPAGYVEKQMDILKLQDERITDHIYKALACINMEFLANTPLNQSGKAKEVDKDEMNNFVFGIAEFIIQAMGSIYCFINDYRYKDVVPNQKAREEQLPQIPVPQKFDLLSSDYLLQELTGTRDAQLNYTTLEAFQVDYCAKRFPEQPEVRQMLELIFKLDPFAAANDDEKLIRLNGGGISEMDYIISSNINTFVKQAIAEDPKFFDKDFPIQKAKMVEYASAKQKEISLAAKTKAALLPKPVVALPPNPPNDN